MLGKYGGWMERNVYENFLLASSIFSYEALLQTNQCVIKLIQFQVYF